MKKSDQKEKPQILGEVKNVRFSQNSKNKRSPARDTGSKKSSQVSLQQINTGGDANQEMKDRDATQQSRKTNVTVISNGVRPGMRNLQGAAKPRYLNAIQDAIELTHNKVREGHINLQYHLCLESERQECIQR